MKNSKKLLAFRRKAGLIALIAIMALTMATCGGNDDPGNDPNGPDGPSGPKPFTSVEEVKDYIISAEGGATADDPVFLPVKINLGTSTENPYSNGWFRLMGCLRGGGGYKDGELIPVVDKYVSLDLSACTLNEAGTESVFRLGGDHENADTKGKVVSLVLPDAAVSIDMHQSGPSDTRLARFTGFTALRSVSGKGFEELRETLFLGLTTLESASFPNVKTIKGSYDPGGNFEGASGARYYGPFRGCTALKTVSFPSVETIEQYAFTTPNALESITIGDGAAGVEYMAGESFKTAYDAGGAGTYTRTPPSEDWTKQ